MPTHSIWVMESLSVQVKLGDVSCTTFLWASISQQQFQSHDIMVHKINGPNFLKMVACTCRRKQKRCRRYKLRIIFCLLPAHTNLRKTNLCKELPCGGLLFNTSLCSNHIWAIFVLFFFSFFFLKDILSFFVHHNYNVLYMSQTVKQCGFLSTAKQGRLYVW